MLFLWGQHHRHPHQGKSDLSRGRHQETGLCTLKVASSGPGVDSLPDVTAQVQVMQHTEGFFSFAVSVGPSSLLNVLVSETSKLTFAGSLTRLFLLST